MFRMSIGKINPRSSILIEIRCVQMYTYFPGDFTGTPWQWEMDCGRLGLQAHGLEAVSLVTMLLL